MPSKMNSCLWLINHEALRQWEIPLLKEAGFSRIYTPQGMPHSPAFTSGTVTPLEGDWSFLTKKELAILASQDWYEKIDDRAARIASENFDCAFVTAVPRQVIAVLKAFSGVVIIRLFGLDGNRTYSELFTFELSPHELAYVHQNLHRIVFATGYEELLVPEEDWVVENSVFLPIGLASEGELKYQGSEEDIFAVIPRIEPNSYYENSFLKHTKMIPRATLKVAGRQHLTFKDKRILGTLKRSEFDTLLSKSRAMIYASREKLHVHYHPLEAMQNGMPVVYFQDTLLHSVMRGSSLGAVKSFRQARVLVRKMIKNPELAKEIGRSQREIVLRMASKELREEFLLGCAQIARKQEAKISEELISIIICSQKHPKSTCPAIKLVPHNWLMFSDIAQLQTFLNSVTGESSPLDLVTHENAISRVDGKSRHSRSFQFANDFQDLMWLSPKNFRVVLCDVTEIKKMLTTCEVTRVLSADTCKSFMNSGKSPEIELLRYTLSSLDRIVVPNNESKELLLAFTPINNYLVDVLDMVNT